MLGERMSINLKSLLAIALAVLVYSCGKTGFHSATMPLTHKVEDAAPVVQERTTENVTVIKPSSTPDEISPSPTGTPTINDFDPPIVTATPTTTPAATPFPTVTPFPTATPKVYIELKCAAGEYLRGVEVDKAVCAKLGEVNLTSSSNSKTYPAFTGLSGYSADSRKVRCTNNTDIMIDCSTYAVPAGTPFCPSTLGIDSSGYYCMANTCNSPYTPPPTACTPGANCQYWQTAATCAQFENKSNISAISSSKFICPINSFVKSFNQDGSVACEAFTVASLTGTVSGQKILPNDIASRPATENRLRCSSAAAEVVSCSAVSSNGQRICHANIKKDNIGSYCDMSTCPVSNDGASWAANFSCIEFENKNVSGNVTPSSCPDKSFSIGRNKDGSMACLAMGQLKLEVSPQAKYWAEGEHLEHQAVLRCTNPKDSVLSCHSIHSSNTSLCATSVGYDTTGGYCNPGGCPGASNLAMSGRYSTYYTCVGLRQK